MGEPCEGGGVEGFDPYLHPSPRAPRDVSPGDALLGGFTILYLPASLEEMLERVEPDFLGYDATIHSDRCYTVTMLTLEYRYRVFRCHLSDDDRWTINPLDADVTFQLLNP